MKHISTFYCLAFLIAISTCNASVNVSFSKIIGLAQRIGKFKAPKVWKRSHHHHNEKTDTSWFEHGLNLMLGE